MKFKSALIVMLTVLVISTLIVETECQKKRGVRKARDILLPCKKAMDAEDKKKRSLMSALKHSLYNSDELL